MTIARLLTVRTFFLPEAKTLEEEDGDHKIADGDGEIFLPFDDSQGRTPWPGVWRS